MPRFATRSARRSFQRRVARTTSALLSVALIAAGLVSITIATQAETASAASDPLPFPTGMSQYWVSQGSRPTLLYTAVQSDDGFHFGAGETDTATDTTSGTIEYNALAYNDEDNFLYAVRNGSGALLQIGQDGLRKNLGRILGTTSTAAVNQGTFGDGAYAGIYFIRDNAENTMYMVDVSADPVTVTAVPLTTGGIVRPNLSDFVWKDGYLWGVWYDDSPVTGYMYRIYVTPADGHPAGWMQRFPLNLPQVGNYTFGAQWLYGNGNIGLSANGTSGQTVPYYQIAIDNSTSATPSFRFISATNGDSSLTNDGASYTGDPVDLSIVKAGQDFVAGGTVSYTLTIKNEQPLGGATSSGYQVSDPLPAGMISPSTSNPGCSISGDAIAGYLLTCGGGTLAPQATRTITVTANTAPDATCISNTGTVTGNEEDPNPGNNTSTAEVCAVTGSFVVSKTADVDSIDPRTYAKPGETVTYTITVTNPTVVDLGAGDPAGFTDSLDGVLDDSSFVAGSIIGGATYDATTQQLSWSGPLAAGASHVVMYSVVVDDPVEGDFEMKNLVTPTEGGSCASVADCQTVTPIPAYTVEKSADVATTVPDGTVNYTIRVTNIGRVDYDPTLLASFSDDLSDVLLSADYNGDAVYATLPADADYDAAETGPTYSAPTLAWSGSLAIGATKTFTYSVTVHAAGSVGDGILENTVDPEGGICVTAESCMVVDPIAGYELVKTADAASVRPGDTLTYTVTVTNTGFVDYVDPTNPATFTDELDDVLDDATFNGSSLVSSSGTATFIPADLVADTPATISWHGSLPVGGAAVTVTYSVTVNDPVDGDLVLRNAACTPAGECERVQTPVARYEVTKSADVSMVAPEGVVVYTITVENTGAVAYLGGNPASFSDDLSDVLLTADYNGDAAYATAVADAGYDPAETGPVYSAPLLAWSGSLDIGVTKTFTYSVTVHDADDLGDKLLSNTVDPGVGYCVAAADCEVDVPVSDYSLVKTASVTFARPGDVVTYTVVVTNQSDVAFVAGVNPAAFTDVLTDVLDDATYNVGSVTATSGIAGYTPPNPGLGTEGVIAWSGGLPVGGAVTVTYSVTVNSPVTGDMVLRNAACITVTACSRVDTPIELYRVTKVSDVDMVSPAGIIVYTITVENVGQVSYTAGHPASFVDDLSDVLLTADYNGDAVYATAVSDADYDPTETGPTYASPQLAWSGALAIGVTKTFTYSVAVHSAGALGDRNLVNTVDPVDGECLTAADCTVTVVIPEYSVLKSADRTTVIPGDTVTYTVTVTNTGTVDLVDPVNPATFTDDLSDVLDDATFDAASLSSSTGTALYTPASGSAPATIRWSGTLLIGAAPAVITYSVTVGPVASGDMVLRNAACITPALCSRTEVPVRAYTVSKAADTAQVARGGTVRYTIIIANVGEVDYTAASLSDDLEDVLRSAGFDGTAVLSPADPAAAVSYVEPELSWVGGLAVGEVKTLRYSVTVNEADIDDGVLVNTVVADSLIGGYCDPAASCVAEVRVGALAMTGVVALGAWLAAAGVALLGGLLLVNTGGRRSRVRH